MTEPVPLPRATSIAAPDTDPSADGHADAAAVSAAPMYFSDRDGPGDDATLLAQLTAVIAQERVARGLPPETSPETSAQGPGSPAAVTEVPSTIAPAAMPLPTPAAPPVVDQAAPPPGAAASVARATVRASVPDQSPRAESAGSAPSDPAEDAVATVAADPPADAASAALGTIPIAWGTDTDAPYTSELTLERVEPIPHRPHCWYVVGHWPTGQGAVWEVNTYGPWGRGTGIKLRWETGRQTGAWAAGYFQVERVERGNGAQTLIGLWPNAQRGAITLPAPFATWCAQAHAAIARPESGDDNTRKNAR